MKKNHDRCLAVRHKAVISILLIFMAFVPARTQVPTLYYDFENNGSRTTFENQVEQSVNTGSGALTRTGGTTTISGGNGAGIFNGGSSSGQGSASDTWQTGTSDPGTSATDYLEFVVNTSGLAGITLLFDNEASSTGPARAGLLYSTDGSTFTSAGTVLTGNAAWSTASFDLSAVSAIENQVSVTIRIYAYEGSGADRTGRGTFDGAGTLIIDNLTVLSNQITSSKTLLDYPAIGVSVRSGSTFMPAYTNFSIAGSGTTASLASDINLSGTLTIGSGADLRNPSGTGRTISMTGSSSAIVVDGTITGTDIGAGNDVNLLISGSGCSITGSGSLAQFLNLTVNSGSTLSLGRTVEVKYVATTINGTVQINNGGFLNRTGGSSISYGATSALTYNPGVGNTYSASNTTSEFPSSGVVNLNVLSGTLAIPAGVSRSVSGNVTVSSGSTLALTSGLTLSGGSSTALTVNGVLRVNTGGGFVSRSGGATIGYGASSTLEYTGPYDVTTNEFPAAGVVNLRIVSGNGASSVTLGANRTLTGTLTVEDGAELRSSAAGVVLTMAGSAGVIVANGSGAITGTNTAPNDLSLLSSGATTVIEQGTAPTGIFRFLNITVDPGSTLALRRELQARFGTVAVNGTLRIDNNTTAFLNTSVAGEAATVSYGASSLLRYDASYTSTNNEFPATGVVNVTVGGAGTTLTLNGGKTITGTLALGANNLDGGQALSANVITLSTGTLSVANLTTIGTGAALTSSGASTINVTGTWNVAGFSAGTGTVVLNGSSAQSIASASTFNNLTVNNSAGVTIGAGLNPVVAGALSLTNGIVATGTGSLSISAAGSVSRTNGHVNGTFRKNVATGATSRTFEVGDATVYAPVTIAFASVSVAGDLAVATASGDHPNIATSGLNISRSVNRYWTATNSGITFTTYSATLNFAAGDVDGGSTTSNFVVRKYNAPTWSTTTAGTRTATSTQATGLTSFSDFAIGEVQTYTITASASANGTISPSGSVVLNAGDNQAFTITPGTGYHIDSVVVDGVNQGAITGYTFTSVAANHTISAYFSINTYTITATAAANGTITPSGAVSVNHGANQAFTISATTGYHIDSVVVDGTNQGAIGSYTFTNVTAAHTINAYFSINRYTITATASANGTITPSGAVLVNHGSNQAFTISANTGYHIDSVVVDGTNQGTIGSYTFTNVTANHTINAYFSINVYTITATAAANGTITPSGAVSANHGANQAFTISANSGYHIDSVVVDGTNQGAIGSYTFTNVTANHSISAYFSINVYTITATAAANGTVSPSGAVSVNHGANQAFTISANTGYHIDSVVVDGANQGAIGSYTFTNVTANHTISAYFSINRYTITATAAANGTISPSGSVLVNHGSNQAFTISANTGYHIDSVVVDGANQGAIGSYTFTNVTANHTISAYFSINVYTITASAGANGTISPSGSVQVNHGSNQLFTISPNSGYHIDSVVVDGANQGTTGSYTFTNVTANHTIAAYFSINVFTITATASAGGSISPSGSVPLNSGASQSFTITPTTGYHIDSVIVDGANQGAIGSYSFTNVTANHTISAYFSINRYTITASASANGTISPTGAVLVNHGSDQVFTITPNTGYHVDSVVVDGVNQGSSGSYTFTNVTANHTIAAYFSINVYTITASVTGNGTITPSGVISLNHGASQSFSISAATGYHIDSVVVDGVNQGAVTGYSFTTVTASHVIQAYVSINVYTITATADPNGTITPSGAVAVNHGTNRTFTVSANTGYHLDSVLVDGFNIGAVTNYTFTNVTSNHTIHAYFTINTYTITATAGANGSISPSGAVAANFGSNQTFTMLPNTGYHVDSVIVDGVYQGALANYTFTGVAANHTIAVRFAINAFTITATAGSGGTITPSGSVNASFGGNQSFSIAPNTGYHIDSVVVDGFNQGAITSYAFTNITSDHTIDAYFTINTYTITATAGANGSISPSGAIAVTHGTDQSFTITPATGYHIDSVLVDGVNQGAVGSYTFTAIAGNRTISAFFSINVYAITSSVVGSGTITPSGAVGVAHGAGQSFTIAPLANYHIDSVLVDGVNQGAITSYTFTNVTANASITAYFSIDTHMITTTAGVGGSISPGGSVAVNHGADQTFTIAPNINFHIDSVVVDGVNQGAVTSYTFTNVTTTHTLNAYFTVTGYIISATATAGGTISPSGDLGVLSGTSQAFTMSADTGYHLDSVVVDGVNQGPVSSYTFTNVTANHTIAAHFSVDLFTITATAAANGSITPSGGVQVPYATDQTFSVVPGTGYHIDSVLVDGVNQGAVASYTFTGVTAAHTIAAYFSINTYAIAVTAGANGTVAPGTLSVNHGSDQTFTITADVNHHIDSVVVDGVNQGAVGSYTFSNVTATHSIAAYFSIDRYTIAASAASGGTISPSGAVVVDHGSGQAFTITPDLNYHIDSVVVDGVNQGAVGTYTFTNVIAPHTIASYFSIDTYIITAGAGTNGTITPSGSVVVPHGSDQAFTITPDPGYHIDSVVVDGIDQGAVGSYQFTAVTAIHSIQVYFSINTYSITATATSGGSIAPAGNTTVNHGADQAYVITADPGYHIDSVIVDGVSIGAAGAYTFTGVTSAHTIAAYFSINAYTISAAAGAGGSISPSGSVLVLHGADQAFTLTPDVGYHVDSLVVDGVNQGALTSYTFTGVIAAHTINAYFSIDVFTITATAGLHGTIAPAGTVPVNYGSGATFTFTPDSGYHVDSVIVDGIPVSPAGDYTFSGVTASHTIAVTFAINQYTITASASSGGTISPSGVLDMTYGASQAFTLTPDIGHHIDSLVVDGVNLGAIGSYTFNSISGSHVIAAYFSIDQFAITINAGPNGSISPAGPLNVPYGSSQAFTIAPATGYHTDSVVVDGANLGVITDYTFTNVTSTHAISAYFSINYYTITATAGPTGSITPSGVVTLSHGSNQSYTIAAQSGYHIDSVVVDGVNQGALTAYTFSALSASHTIAAYFSINAYIITATAGTGGTITPSGAVGVSHGGIQSFVATPNTGYHIDSLIVDGINIGVVSNYTFTNVTTGHTISAYFSVNSYTLTAVAGSNGTISPAGVLSLVYGSSQTFNITPNSGYHIDSVLVDGINVGPTSVYAFTNISANHSIVAYFSSNIYVITSTAGAGGSISPSGAVNVNYNANQNFLIIPNASYHVDSVVVDGVNLGAITSYTFLNVMANHTIQAYFTFNSYTITATATPGGTISPPGVINVTQGANVGFTIAALFGYRLDSVTVDGANLGPVLNYVFTNVTSSHTINAYFSLTSYTITAVVAGNGTITPSGAVPIVHGTNQAFAIAPNTGYHIDSVVVDGANVGPVADYTFTNVVANHTIIAYFSGNIQTITASADTGGSITPSGIVNVPYGSSQEFAIVAVFGYHIDSVVVDGVDQGAVELYRFTSISSNHTIRAYFSPNVYTLTASVSGPGTIAPSGTVLVPHGGSQSYTITPASGYHVDSLVIDGANVGVLLAYSFTNVVANHVIVAYISINTYTITALVSGGGTISPTGVINVPGGGNRTFTIAALAGNHLDSVLVDGVNRGPITTYSFLNVQTSHTITAYFSINIYPITATAIGGGRINPSGTLMVAHGSSRMFTMSAPSGYHIDSVVVDGVSQGAITTYTFSGVTSAHTITAYFNENRYPLTLYVSGRGTVTRVPNQVLYPHGTVVTLTAVPDSGWVFDGWSGAVSGNANPIYVVMTSARTISASFSQYRYRTATYEQWATTVDANERLKPVKNTPDKVAFRFDLLVESNPVLFLDFSMDVTDGVVTRGTDTIAHFHGRRPAGISVNVVSGETVQVAGIGLKGKAIKAKYSWGSVNKVAVTTFIDNSPMLPLPNLHNVGEELFLQSAFGPGLLVGMEDNPRSVQMSRYRDVQKSLNHNGMLHTGPIRCIAFFDATGQAITRQQKTLPADRHNNKLFAEVVALKLNIAASAYNNFPNGFGELTFNDAARPSNPFNGLMVNEIAEVADSFLSCLTVAVTDTTSLYSTLRMLNGAFADSNGAIDTVGFAVKTQLRGVRTLDDVPYLRVTPNAQPVNVNRQPDFTGTVPTHYALEQNYPNPFNPVTTIQFTLPVASRVTIAVFNMLGQQVATLLDGEAIDEGVQEVEFNAQTLASGIYFYRLSAEELSGDGEVLGLAFTDLKKMVLVK